MTVAATTMAGWGERTALLPKTLTYLFSLDLWFALRSEWGHVTGDEVTFPLELIGPGGAMGKEPSSYHVLRSDRVTTADGGDQVVPQTWATRGDDRLRLRSDGTATMDGRVILDGDFGQNTSVAGRVPDLRRVPNQIALSYRGVAQLDRPLRWLLNDPPRGPSGIRQRGERATAFAAFSFDSGHPRYRWLVIAPCVGFGTVWVDDELKRDVRGEYRRLLFTYDVHSAA